MTLQNRVLPTGEIVAEPWRGEWMGNRGILHDAHKSLGRVRWRHQNWVTCQLRFKDRKREVMRAGSFYTELFFFDEAGALAAGHRPCAECRHADYMRFRAAWAAALGETPRAADMDRRLHAVRVDRPARPQKRWQSPAASLPPGAMFLLGEVPALVGAGAALVWTGAGYGTPRDLPPGWVSVCTPRSTVATLKAGYLPKPHRSLATID